VTRGETRYARNGDVTLAWSETGDGPLDLLFLQGFISHVEQIWEEPGVARYLDRLASFSRLILMDRRGTGMSDPYGEDDTLDTEVGDVLAVLDAAGSERAVLMGHITGGAPAIRLAATMPERVRALILYSVMARNLAAPGYEWTYTPEERQANIELMVSRWGTGELIDTLAPSRVGDERLRAWLARLERHSSSPGEVRRMLARAGDFDVREDLPRLRVPTLVMHRREDRMIDIRHSRYLAEHIPGARYVELEGEDNLATAGDVDALIGEIEEFLTGGRTRTAARRLLTVLFTDIVGSTGHAARLGDARGSDALAAHAAAVRREIARFGGHEVKTIGDAFLVTFEGAPSRAVGCADAIAAAVERLELQVRIGLHTGECELLGDDIGGMAVHIAARVAATAEPGEVMASGTTYGTVVGSGLRWEDRGMCELKGVPGRWPLFALRR